MSRPSNPTPTGYSSIPFETDLILNGQLGMVRPQRGLHEKSVSILRAWFFEKSKGIRANHACIADMNIEIKVKAMILCCWLNLWSSFDLSGSLCSGDRNQVRGGPGISGIDFFGGGERTFCVKKVCKIADEIREMKQATTKMRRRQECEAMADEFWYVV
ncbi:hypothetical protein Bca101_082426 [Brassica carinata]